MKNEKGITLVALIGIVLLLVILTGISISIAVKDSVKEQPINNVNPVEDDFVYEDDIVDTTEDMLEENTSVENEVEDDNDELNPVSSEM